MDDLTGCDVADVYDQHQALSSDHSTVEEVRGVGQPVEEGRVVEVPDRTQRRPVRGDARHERALEEGVDVHWITAHRARLAPSSVRRAAPWA